MISAVTKPSRNGKTCPFTGPASDNQGARTTQGWSQTTTASLAGAARSPAEVIVEAPCCTASGGILPLADFGTVNITSSMANGAALGSAGGVTQIVMIDNAGSDKARVSSLSGGGNFSATWLGSS